MQKIVLIGGPPMSGKSSVAKILAAKHSRTHISIDDLATACRAISTPQSHPDLHSMTGIDYREYYIRFSSEELIVHAQAEHNALWPAVKAITCAHESWGEPAIIEGWQINPDFANELADRSVQSVWLIPDADLLESRLRADSGFYSGASDPERMIRAYLSRSIWHSKHIEVAAIRLGLPVVRVSKENSPSDVARLVEAAISFQTQAASGIAEKIPHKKSS